MASSGSPPMSCWKARSHASRSTTTSAKSRRSCRYVTTCFIGSYTTCPDGQEKYMRLSLRSTEKGVSNTLFTTAENGLPTFNYPLFGRFCQPPMCLGYLGHEQDF